MESLFVLTSKNILKIPEGCVHRALSNTHSVSLISKIKSGVAIVDVQHI